MERICSLGLLASVIPTSPARAADGLAVAPLTKGDAAARPVRADDDIVVMAAGAAIGRGRGASRTVTASLRAAF